MVEIWSYLSVCPGSDGIPRVSSSQPQINRLGAKAFRPLAAVSVGGEVRAERELKFKSEKGANQRSSSGFSTFEEFVGVQLVSLPIPIF